MIKQIKKTNAKIKAIIDTTPKIKSFCLNAKIPFNKGKNKNIINPTAALIPCIFEAPVTIFLLSFTLKNPEISPAPIAKMPIERSTKTAKTRKLTLIDRKYTTAVNARKSPSQISHKL